jgi:S-adenosyl methyltransferase
VTDEPRAPAGIDVTTPLGARVYDYILGGKDNFAVDREAAERLLEAAPDGRLLARLQRKFLVRVVRLMAESGIRQFIDLGTGIPTSPSVHEVARAVDASARVVYVDFNAMVVVHNRALLATDDGVITIEEDIREPDKILANPELRALIDFEEPVGVLMLAVIHNVSDEYDPAGIVARFRNQMAPGSHIAISQFAPDGEPQATAQLEAVYAATPWPKTLRSREEIQRLFDGFELLPPGVVDVQRWRPEEGEPPRTTLSMPGGVGRKP